MDRWPFRRSWLFGPAPACCSRRMQSPEREPGTTTHTLTRKQTWTYPASPFSLTQTEKFNLALGIGAPHPCGIPLWCGYYYRTNIDVKRKMYTTGYSMFFEYGKRLAGGTSGGCGPAPGAMPGARRSLPA